MKNEGVPDKISEAVNGSFLLRQDIKCSLFWYRNKLTTESAGSIIISVPKQNRKNRWQTEAKGKKKIEKNKCRNAFYGVDSLYQRRKEIPARRRSASGRSGIFLRTGLSARQTAPPSPRSSVSRFCQGADPDTPPGA
jgi:hypothetical protein